MPRRGRSSHSSRFSRTSHSNNRFADASKLASATALVLETLEGRRLLSAGNLDASFGNGGVVLTDFQGATLDVAHDATPVGNAGKIVAVGESDGRIALARYNSDGSLDSSFGDTGHVVFSQGQFMSGLGISQQADGKLLVAGSINQDLAVLRFSADGALDTSFGNGGLATLGLFGASGSDVLAD